MGALESCASRTELGMKAYFYYFFISSAPAVWLFWYSSESDDICKLRSIDHQLQRVSNPLSCTILHFLWFFASLGIFLVLAFSAHVIWDLKEYLRQRELSDNLIRHEEPMMKKLRAGFGDAGDKPPLEEELSRIRKSVQDWRHSGAEEEDARPKPGSQPAWGALPVAAKWLER